MVGWKDSWKDGWLDGWIIEKMDGWSVASLTYAVDCSLIPWSLHSNFRSYDISFCPRRNMMCSFIIGNQWACSQSTRPVNICQFTIQLEETRLSKRSAFPHHIFIFRLLFNLHDAAWWGSWHGRVRHPRRSRGDVCFVNFRFELGNQQLMNILFTCSIF